MIKLNLVASTPPPPITINIGFIKVKWLNNYHDFWKSTKNMQTAYFFFSEMKTQFNILCQTLPDTCLQYVFKESKQGANNQSPVLSVVSVTSCEPPERLCGTRVLMRINVCMFLGMGA